MDLSKITNLYNYIYNGNNNSILFISNDKRKQRFKKSKIPLMIITQQ